LLRESASGSLSGGERQMLGVGRALMANPAVIVLDEPTEGLAPVVVQAIGTLLRQLRENDLGVLLAEQNHHLALAVADRVYFLEKGHIALECTAAEARNPEVLTRYLGV
jgi:branched-chain amino acid transport system ATP-binding protein